jgi:2,4-dienoyl-CoA reductase-like NADH-dependent reductase (Old Yellow Enzyme family)
VTQPANNEALLFSPLDLREVRLKNRIVVAPMCQYSAEDGLANDWHFAHLAKFAVGGAGLVMAEAAAVEERGRITFGDIGLWRDDQVAPLARIAGFIKAQGSAPAIQLAHAGRKSSMQRPWHGNGPLGEADAARGERPWSIMAPSPLPVAEDWLLPHEIGLDDIRRLREAFAGAARRALEAGFEVVEVHGAHGYLNHSFLSPLSNRRNDAYGGDRAGRMRFPLEVAEAVRAEWPDDKPVFFRVSSVDGLEGGWELEDTVALSRELKARGIDVVDCSSGGLTGSATAARIPRTPGFQVPYAEAVRHQVGIATMAVGLITEARQAEAILEAGQADLIALARELLYNPNWPLHAALELGVDPEYEAWPPQYGWWLVRRARTLARASGD